MEQLFELISKLKLQIASSSMPDKQRDNCLSQLFQIDSTCTRWACGDYNKGYMEELFDMGDIDDLMKEEGEIG